MNIVILDADTLGNDVDLSLFREFGDVKIYAATAPGQTAERIADAEVVIVNKVRLNPETLGDPERLKLVCIAATGYDNIDVSYLRAKGIGLCNVAGYSTDSVAQITIAMALSLTSHLSEYRSFVADGSYTRSGAANRLTPVYHEIAGKTWGIVGYGSIGQKVGAVASALGCRILVCKQTPLPGVECVDIDRICADSDVISLHVPLTETTGGMISWKRIAAMKPGVILINTARGAVCDEKALCAAVKEGKIGGLGIDVYSTEPFSKSDPLYEIKDYPNVCLTPHMAWGAYEARVRCLSEIAENIRSFRVGEMRSRIV